jgi:hypothetical protein
MNTFNVGTASLICPSCQGTKFSKPEDGGLDAIRNGKVFCAGCNRQFTVADYDAQIGKIRDVLKSGLSDALRKALK